MLCLLSLQDSKGILFWCKLKMHAMPAVLAEQHGVTSILLLAKIKHTPCLLCLHDNSGFNRSMIVC